MATLEGRRGNGQLFRFAEGGIQQVFGVEWERPQAFSALDGKDLDGIWIVPIIAVGRDVILLEREQHKVHSGGGDRPGFSKFFCLPTESRPC